MAVFSNDDNKLINFRPICVGAICFLMGIYCAFCIVCQEYLSAILPILLFLAVLLAIKLIGGKKLKFSLFLVGCFLIIFALGFGNFLVRAESAKSARPVKSSGAFVGTVDEIKKYDEDNYRIVFRDCSLDGVKISGKSLCYTNSYYIDQVPIVGGCYFFDCQIENRFEKSKDEYEIYNGVYFLVSPKNSISYLRDEANLFERAQRGLSNLLSKGMGSSSYSLALALTIGDTSNLSYDALSNYRMAGIAHVFAVSGLHVGTLALVLSFIAKRLKLGRVGVLIFTAIPLLFYCGICGFSPSSLRAFTMSISLLLANVVGFKRDGLSALAIASVIIALINPVCIFEKGFQLSFVCVGSIIILSPIFKRGASAVSVMKNSLSTALSVQVGTLPIITDMCGYMSIISLLSNLIFIPIMMLCYQILMVSVGFALAEGLFFGVTNNSLFIIDKILCLVGDFINLFSFENAVLPITFGSASVVYYAGVVLVSDVVNLGVKNKIAIGVVCLILTVLLLVL